MLGVVCALRVSLSAFNPDAVQEMLAEIELRAPLNDEEVIRYRNPNLLWKLEFNYALITRWMRNVETEEIVLPKKNNDGLEEIEGEPISREKALEMATENHVRDQLARIAQSGKVHRSGPCAAASTYLQPSVCWGLLPLFLCCCSMKTWRRRNAE